MRATHQLFFESSLTSNRREPHICVAEFTSQVACRPTTTRRKTVQKTAGHYLLVQLLGVARLAAGRPRQGRVRHRHQRYQMLPRRPRQVCHQRPRRLRIGQVREQDQQ